MERLVRDCFRQGGYAYARSAAEVAKEYGVLRIARLASNENPRPPSTGAVHSGCEALGKANRYPDECVSGFREALRRFHGNYPFVTGVGMDGVIETTVRTLVDPGDHVVISTPTFSFYRLAAVAQGADVRTVPRGEGFAVDPDALVRAASGAKLTFLCSPNNPTGNATPYEVIEEILEQIEGFLFLDNAYVEFSDLDYLPLLGRHENLIIGRTMSKIFSLAGLRVGYAFVPAWFEPFYSRASTPHALNSVSSAAASAALDDRSQSEKTREYVKGWRERMTKACRLPVYPSDANFIMVDVAPCTGDEMVERLASRGVLVRSCRTFQGLPDHYIRVSVGEEWENELFLEEINRP